MVSHGDRDVEFILLKRTVEAEIVAIGAEEDTETWSCERWAEELLVRMQLDKVEVSEDGENGAVVER
jgi:DNA-binding transcriptional regulator/RsmH inhibitor MraZ